MSQIQIKRLHQRSQPDARKLADDVAADLAEQFDVAYEWEGDTLHFERPGINGQILVNDTHIEIDARLGLLLFALKPAIEKEVNRYLDTVLT